MPVAELRTCTIAKIELSTEDLAQLKKVLNSPKMCSWSKEVRQRRLIGSCDCCGIIPEFIVTRYYDGVKRLERYCERCLQQRKIKDHSNSNNNGFIFHRCYVSIDVRVRIN